MIFDECSKLHSRANILIDHEKDISNDQILIGFSQAVEYFLNERFLFIGVSAELLVRSVITLTAKKCMF